MKTRRNKRWKLAAWMVAWLAAQGAAAEPTKIEDGRQLWSRDFADGQLGMHVVNVAGGKAEVVEVGGLRQAKVTLQFTPRVNRHQLQFFVDVSRVDPALGRYYLAEYGYRFGGTSDLQMAAELFPHWLGNQTKSGPAKVVWSQTTKPEPQGWRTTRVVFHASDTTWDGHLLQFRLLLFRDGMQQGESFETFFRNVELRQLTTAQTNELQPGMLASAAEAATPKPPAAKDNAPEAIVVPVTFTLSKPQAVTLVVEDAQGRRVRNLFGAKEFPAGTHTVSWDGLVESDTETVTIHGHYTYGIQKLSLAQPGTYRVRALVHDPIDIRYEFAVNTGGTPPWKTVDGTGGWLHDHRPPSDVVLVPQTKRLLVASAVGEIGHGMVYLEPGTGKKLAGARSYGVGGGWCGAQWLARDAGPKARPEVQAFSATAFGEFVELWEHSDRGHFKLYSHKRADKKAASCAGLAVFNDRAVISLPDDGQLLIVDVLKGKLAATVPMSTPEGVAFLPTGELLVISDKTVRRFPAFDLATAATTLITDRAQTVVGQGLDDPRCLRLFGERLFVSDWGSSQQVKLFDLAGKPLGAIGKAGLPRVGRYDEAHMHQPAGCWLVTPEDAGRTAFDGAPPGQPVLWVAEADMRPKRLSVWTLDGKLLKAFYGPPGYGGGGFLDAADKTRFFYDDMEFRLDWEKGESRLVNVYARGALPLPGGMPETPIVIGGRRYLVNTFTPPGVQAGPGFVSVYLYSEQGELRPAAVVGSLGSMRDWPPLKTAALEALCKGQNLLAWSDLNADGAVQAKECSVSDATGSGDLMVDPTLRVSTGSGFVVAPTRFTDAGMPVYDLATLASAVEPKTAGGPLFSSDGWLISVGLPIRGVRSGSPAWTYPQTHAGIQGSQPAGPPEYPGHVIGTTHLAGCTVTPKAGDAGEVWTVIGNRGNLFMFTTDGLFVTELFRDRIAAGHGSGPDPVVGPTDAKRGLSLKEMSLGEEAFWPSITQTKDGEIYLVAGHGFSAICRVTGLDTVKRLPPQTIELTPALVETARQQRVRRQQAEIAASGPKSLTVGLSRAVVTVDGQADDWTKAAFVPIADALKGAMQVSGDRLHVVVMASGNARYADYLTNVTAVDNLLFKGGGALDLQLGINPKADPKRQQPVAGDLRLLVARVGGKTKAMLYRQVVPGTQEPETFISPVKRVSIDRIDDVSDAVQVAASPLSPAPGTYADEVVRQRHRDDRAVVLA
ncbi:MAG: hypothetical protein NTY19_25210 [Planctomycetota bacterium]|nr:hypothetical protein [Planctomycetota bacterium]